MTVPSNADTHLVQQTATAAPDMVRVEDLIRLIRNNLLLLISLPLIGGVLAVYYGLAQPKLYQATALLQLDPRPAKPLARSDELYDPGYESFSYYGTQARILTSRKLAEQLVERLDLVSIPEFGGSGFTEPAWWEAWVAKLPGMPEASLPQPIPDASRLEMAIRRTEGAISAQLAPSTTLFQVSFLSQDRELAARAANTLCDLYIEELLQARLDIYSKANFWLADKLNTVQGELNEAEKALQGYRDERDIVNVGGNRGLLEAELTDLSRRLREAERKRRELQNLYTEIQRLSQQGANLADAQPLFADPSLRESARAFQASKAQLDELESRYGKRHPQYLAALTRFESLESSYREQLSSNARSVQAELQSARATEDQIRADRSRTEQKLRNLDRDEFRLNMLERNVSNNRQLYDAFLARFQETESNSSFSEANARVADPAVPPRSAYGPNIRKLGIIGFALGGVLALMLVLLREVLRARIESPDELEALTTAPLLGIVPHSRVRKLDQQLVQHLSKDARSPFADAVRSLKTAILINRAADKSSTCLALTSTEPAEGKSTLTVALGCVFAPSARVLLIDTDLRRPRMARMFGARTSGQKGLADVLQGQCTFEEALHTDPVSGLHYLSAGKPPPNPALLLESSTFSELLASVREQYDFVFLDTPPVLATSDALHLVKNIDGFILVARAERTHRKAFLGALKRLETAGAKCRGVVLNDASARRAGYGGYYYYGSSYRY